MYLSPNFKSKAAAKRAIAEGKRVTVFAPGLGTVPENGRATIEGPHYPKPHTFYGTAHIVDGLVVKIV